MNWVLLKNSLLVGGSATLLAAAFGFAAAMGLSGLERRWRMAVMILAVMTLAYPPFLVTNSWLHLLGPAGVWRAWLPLNILSLGGTIWILALLTWPITFLLVLGALRQLDPSQLESDPAVRGWQLIRGILWPISRATLAQSAAITFVLSLNNFAVPAILQVKVFPAEMWVLFNTTFNTLGALKLSWPLLLAPLVLLLWSLRNPVTWPHLAGSVSAKLFRIQLGPRWFWFCIICAGLVCLLSVILPLGELIFVRGLWTELPGAVAAGKLAIWNSAFYAVVSATLITGLSLLLGSRGLVRIGARSTSKFKNFFSLLYWLPFLVPGILLGIALISLFNHPLLFRFYGSAAIVVLAYVIRYSALGWNAVSHGLASLDRDLTGAARLDGASTWQILRQVHWQRLAPAVAAAWYVVFLFCLWDVESMILVVPPGGETLALRVFNLLHYGHNPQVNALCLTLLALAVAPLVIWKTASVIRRAARIQQSGFVKPSAGGPPVGLIFATIIFLLVLPGCTPDSPSTETRLSSQLFSGVHIIGTRGVGVGELNKPRSVAVDAQDNLFVVDMTGRVQKFSPTGAFLLSWQMPQTDKGKPKGMCRDRSGNIVVIEPHYQRVNHFSTEGKLLAQWGQRGTNTGQLIMPRAAAITSQNVVFLSEYGEVERVQAFAAPDLKLGSTNGGSSATSVNPFLFSFGHMGTAPGEFNRPEGLCVDAQDRLYVADSCNHRIQIFSKEGKFIRAHGTAGTGKGQLSYPYDICVDPDGRQYVCEFGNSRIQIFDQKDQCLEIIGGPGAEPGRFNNPWGVALDSAGNLYVADSQNHRVQKFIRMRAPGSLGASARQDHWQLAGEPGGPRP